MNLTDHDDNAWVEVCATAEDDDGASATQCVNVYPELASLTFMTDPSGLDLTYNGVTRAGPFTVEAVVGATRSLDAAVSQGEFAFQSWSQGGAASQNLVIPATPAAFTAFYAAAASNAPVANDDTATAREDRNKRIAVSNNDTDPDGDLIPTSVSIVDGPDHGTAAPESDGRILYRGDQDLSRSGRVHL